MLYRPIYHPDLQSVDIPKINQNIQRRIERAIEKRLTTYPESYGEPLEKNLAGYWKLRVGDYRIVFKVFGEEIVIYGIIDRKDVYREIKKRIPK